MDIEEYEKSLSVVILNPLAHRVMRDDPRNEGRVALHNVGLWLSSFQSLLSACQIEKRVMLPEGRGLFRLGGELLRNTIATGVMRCAGLLLTFLDAIGTEVGPVAAESTEFVKLGWCLARADNGQGESHTGCWRSWCCGQRVWVGDGCV